MIVKVEKNESKHIYLGIDGKSSYHKQNFVKKEQEKFKSSRKEKHRHSGHLTSSKKNNFINDGRTLYGGPEE